LRMLPRLIRHVRERQPAVICSVLVHANVLAAFARPHVREPIAWVHSIHTLQEKPRWHWHATAIAMGMADGVIAPSHAIVRKLESRGMVPRPAVIPNGIDVERFVRASPMAADERPWPAGAVVVGYIGRFDPVKRVHLLLRALRFLLDGAGGKATGVVWPLIERLHVAVIGWGREEYELRRLSAELRLTRRVHFIKPTAVPERWYKTLDVFCLPSKAEGFGLSAVEALAAGNKLVLCESPGVVEAVGEFKDARRIGWISEEPTVEELALALLQMLEHPVPENIGEKLALRFSVEQMVAGYAEYLEQMALAAGALGRR